MLALKIATSLWYINVICAFQKQQKMDFGSEFLYAAENESQEYEYIEETKFNHTATGYSSVSADYKDDGEVVYCTLCT